ncbi:vacuolar protein sorting-associated protein 54-like protein [Dinothrombium tinctorium]|uniref:Vacuolar protein sorting-associated protein 54 n=1 Tax=Dinothrombium tinctorium TaxID=1965070 RepID=A0A443QVJ4_9ACAR|nr:vacuolar protein sorting-associated protein 54-like protein [Dinothrombium tinctorium]
MFPKPSPAVNEWIMCSSGDRKAERNIASQPDILQSIDHFKPWTVYSCSQNLPALLNDPLMPKNVSDTIFTKDWGVYFVDSELIPPSPFLPKVSNRALKSYLKRISLRASVQKQASFRCQPFKFDPKTQPKTKIDGVIPKFFMKSDFSLENIETFSTLLSLNSGNDLLSTSTNNSVIRQELKNLENKLTDYLDIVEENLSFQISLRFRDFFHIMNAMDSVMDQLNKTIKEVTLVRKNCQLLKQALIKPSLRNIQITKTRANAVAVYNKIKLMSTVHQTQPTIQLLLSISDYVGALDLISTSQEVITQELGGLSCFRHLKSQLTEIEKVIDHMMREEFVKYLNAEWNRPLTSESQYVVSDEDRFSSIVLGMLRIQRFDFIDTFREEASTAVKAVLKQTVIEVLSREDNLDVSSRQEVSLFDQLRDLEFAKWISMLSEVFSNLFLLLKRIEAVYSVMLKMVYDASGNPQQDSECKTSSLVARIVSDTDFIKLRPTLNKCLADICDFAHSRCANLVEGRAKESSFDRISSSDFMELAKSVETFTYQCENLCGRRSPNLKLVLQTQANKFATRFHDERRKKLNSLLDIEQWKSIDNVPLEFQEVVTQIIDKESGFDNLQRTNKGNKGNQYIEVRGEKFVVVNSVIALLNTVIEYCQCASEINALSPDLLTRLLDLLKQFNKRVAHLLLGAGACEVAGLKTITARNLIVSLSCLRLILHFVLPIKAHFEKYLPQRQRTMVKHFDDIIELYSQHIAKIPEKLIAVVKDLMMKNMSKWEAKPPVPSPQFVVISQHLKRLHENIKDAISLKDLTDLFVKIHEVFKELLRQRLTQLDIANDNGPQHGLVTLELTFYMQTINKLEGAQHLTNDDLWCK